MDPAGSSTAMQDSDGKKKMLIYGGIALAIVVVIVIIVVVVLMSSSNNTIAVANAAVPNGTVPNVVVPNGATIGNGKNTGNASNVPTGTPGDFFWDFKLDGSGYTGGVTFPEAQEYCQATGGRLAKREDLIRAGEQAGYQKCAAGWLVKTGGLPDAGYYMQAKYSGCGNAGFNGWGTSEPDTRKLGAYCVGTQKPPAGTGGFVYDYNFERFTSPRQAVRNVYGI